MAERDSVKYMQVKYLSSSVGKVFSAVVSGASSGTTEEATGATAAAAAGTAGAAGAAGAARGTRTFTNSAGRRRNYYYF